MCSVYHYQLEDESCYIEVVHICRTILEFCLYVPIQSNQLPLISSSSSLCLVVHGVLIISLAGALEKQPVCIPRSVSQSHCASLTLQPSPVTDERLKKVSFLFWPSKSIICFILAYAHFMIAFQFKQPFNPANHFRTLFGPIKKIHSTVDDPNYTSSRTFSTQIN